MTKISRASFNTTYADSAGTFADNTTRAISEADVRQFSEDIKDSTVFQLDGFLSTSADSTLGVITSNSADASEKFLRFLWYAGSAVSGNQDITASLICPDDGICTITINGQGIAADGSAGISVVKIASFRRDGAADPVQIGATTSVHNVEDSGDTPTITISATTSFIRVSFNSGGVPTYHWTIWADVAITKV